VIRTMDHKMNEHTIPTFLQEVGFQLQMIAMTAVLPIYN